MVIVRRAGQGRHLRPRAQVLDLKALTGGRILLTGEWDGRLRVMAFADDGSVASGFHVLRYDHRSAGSALAVDGRHVYAAGSRTESPRDQSMLLVTGKR